MVLSARTALLVSTFITLLTTVTSGLEIMRSAIRRKDFTDNFFAEWYTSVDNSGVFTMRMTLTIQDVDIKGWTTKDGSFGYWTGIGFGKKQMAGSDIIMCTFRFFNSTNDKFVCVDSFANFNSRPTPDLKDNVVDIETKTSYDFRTNLTTLTAVFEKPLQSDGNS